MNNIVPGWTIENGNQTALRFAVTYNNNEILKDWAIALAIAKGMVEFLKKYERWNHNDAKWNPYYPGALDQ